MAGGDGRFCRSSAGHWKPLFKAWSSDKAAADRSKNGGPPAAPNPSDSDLGTSSQPLQPTKDEWELASGCPGRFRASTEPVKSILTSKGASERKRVAIKLNWLHGLVDQEIEPRPLDLDDRRDWSPMRTHQRKATGVFGEVSSEETPKEGQDEGEGEKPAAEKTDSEAAALKQNRGKDADADDASDAFSDTDDEFADVDDLAEKNMRINQAATKISDVEVEANALDLPLAPLTPLVGQASRGAKSDGSSFASSSVADEEKPSPVVTHEASAASMFTALPAGSACAAVKQLRKQDSKSECSSFGDSDDDDK